MLQIFQETLNHVSLFIHGSIVFPHDFAVFSCGNLGCSVLLRHLLNNKIGIVSLVRNNWQSTCLFKSIACALSCCNNPSQGQSQDICAPQCSGNGSDSGSGAAGRVRNAQCPRPSFCRTAELHAGPSGERGQISGLKSPSGCVSVSSETLLSL